MSLKLALALSLLFSAALAVPSVDLRPSAFDMPKDVAHPGCVVWWFLEGCPLANWWGKADPFGIYPWDIFCAEYPEVRIFNL
jgi:hypothetical protein